jgi:hypothetical protein
MIIKKIYIVFILLITLVISGIAQPNDSLSDAGKWSISLSTDLTSRYIWRGMDLDVDKSPHIQPFLKLNSRNLEAGIWGSYNFAGTYQEIDLYFKLKSNQGFYFQVYDIFIPLSGDDFDFFNYKDKETEHVIEPGIGFDGSDNFPFSFFFGSNVYGLDYSVLGDSISNDKILNSAYFETKYSKTFAETDFAFTLGLTPYKSFYSENFSIVNIGFTASKQLLITEKYSLPLTGSFIMNPDSKKAWFTIIITI